MHGKPCIDAPQIGWLVISMCAQFMQLIASFAKAPKAEMVVQPDTVADDFGGKAMVFIAFRGGCRGHAWLPLRLPVQADQRICIRGVIMPYWSAAE
jgi:hypothetical protein